MPCFPNASSLGSNPVRRTASLAHAPLCPTRAPGLLRSNNRPRTWSISSHSPNAARKSCSQRPGSPLQKSPRCRIPTGLAGATNGSGNSTGSAPRSLLARRNWSRQTNACARSRRWLLREHHRFAHLVQKLAADFLLDRLHGVADRRWREVKLPVRARTVKARSCLLSRGCDMDECFSSSASKSRDLFLSPFAANGTVNAARGAHRKSDHPYCHALPPTT